MTLAVPDQRRVVTASAAGATNNPLSSQLLPNLWLLRRMAIDNVAQDGIEGCYPCSSSDSRVGEDRCVNENQKFSLLPLRIPSLHACNSSAVTHSRHSPTNGSFASIEKSIENRSFTPIIFLSTAILNSGSNTRQRHIHSFINYSEKHVYRNITGQYLIVNSLLFILFLLVLHSHAAPLQYAYNNILPTKSDKFILKRTIDNISFHRLRNKRYINNVKHSGNENTDIKSVNDGELTRHEFAVKYLAEFGYLSSSKLPTPHELQNALRTFQDMTGIPSTGRLDHATINLMTQPRCGNSDVSRLRERRKRFVYISRWENKVHDNVLKLSWFIENYTKDIPANEIKKTVRKAFDLWSSQVKISSMESLSLIFEEASNADVADITILWAEGDHGDAHKFDGPGLDGSNILAHTFYPNYQSRGTLNGDIHLDDYENWNVNGSRDGASFPHVLVHEIGHTLGLGHSKKQQAIMYPIYRKEQLELMQLDLDDKCAINWSYIGASDLCLYIWLLSEVLPKKIAVEKDATYMIEDDNNVWDESERSGKKSSTGQRPLRVTEVFERKLRHVRVPLCREDNHVQSHLEHMLEQRLAFPQQLAQRYGIIVCRFLNALQAQYRMPTTNNFHEVFRVHGVHNYFQDDEKFRSLDQSGMRDRIFDAKFFEWLTNEFIH